MAKISIATWKPAAALAVPPAGIDTQSFFDKPSDPIQLKVHTMAPGVVLTVPRATSDIVIHVWRGRIRVDACELHVGSSLIVERGAALTIAATVTGASLVAFSAAQARRDGRSGGHVHLLPADHVPRASALAGSTGVGGAMHANGACPTCSAWLHENVLAPRTDSDTVAAGDAGIHAHNEDEVIFVTGGEIRLGQRLHGPGTAVAIAADTLYSFTPGPVGLTFINFRAAAPGDILFRSGARVDEVAYWRTRLPAPDYLTITGS